MSTLRKIRSFRKYDGGGLTPLQPRSATPYFQTAKGAQSPLTTGHVQGVGSKPRQGGGGASIPIIGGIYNAVNSLAQPIRQQAEEIDPLTGEYKSFNKAYRTAQAGSFMAPWKTVTDPYATTGEKIAGALGWGAAFQKKIYERKEKDMQNKIWTTNHPNTIGQSQNPYYMAQGGKAGQLAELEDGEVFRTPDGQMSQVNGRTHAQGGELYNLPSGTEILGKNRSSYYDKQFKEVGQRLKRMQDKHTKIMDSSSPMISKRTSKLMLDKVQNEFDSLMNEQESEKMFKYAKGGIHVTGVDMEAYSMATGGVMPVNYMTTKEYKKGGIHIKPENRGKFNATKARTGKTTEELTHSSNPVTRKRAIFAQNAAKWKHPYGGTIRYDGGGGIYPTTNLKPNEVNMFSVADPNTYTYNNIAPVGYIFGAQQPTTQQPKTITPTTFKPVTRTAPINTSTTPVVNSLPVNTRRNAGVFNTPVKNTLLSTPAEMPQQINRFNVAAGPMSSVPTTFGEKFAAARQDGKFNGVGNAIATYAPAAVNLAQGMFGKVDKFNYQNYLNPYIADIRSAMRNRRYNINPQLDANRNAQATYNYNLRNAGASPSQLVGGLQSGTIARQRADAQAYAAMQNANNQYLGEQATMDYRLGYDAANVKMQGYDINMRNKAAKKGYLQAGLSQLQQAAQVKQLEKNQVHRDAQKLGLLKDLYSDFSYSDEGWVFNGDGKVKSDDWVKKYLRGK